MKSQKKPPDFRTEVPSPGGLPSPSWVVPQVAKRTTPPRGVSAGSYLTQQAVPESFLQRFAFGGGNQSLNPPKFTPKNSLRLKLQLVKTAIPGLIRNPPQTSPKGCPQLRFTSPKGNLPASFLTGVKFLRRSAQHNEVTTKDAVTKLELSFSVHQLFTTVKNLN